MVDDGESPDGDMAFRARALAQAHPLSEVAAAYRADVVEVERETQPMAQFADWAATAFLVGYCVRRVEEADATAAVSVAFGVDVVDPGVLGASASRIADDIRNGRPSGTALLDGPMVEGVLDAVIGSEVDKRVEHWRQHVNDDDWATFEEYVAWWVVHGYSLRAAERPAMVVR